MNQLKYLRKSKENTKDTCLCCGRPEKKELTNQLALLVDSLFLCVMLFMLF